MCHDQFHRARAWDRETDDADEPAAESADDGLPPFLADEEPDEDLDLLTDGGE